MALLASHDPNIAHNRWHPDTSSCVIDYTWDRRDTAENRIHTPERIEKDCPEYPGITDPVALYDVILKDNQTKNQFLDRALAAVSKLRKVVDGSNALADGVVYKWAFTGTGTTRVLQPEFTGVNLTPQDKNTLRAITGLPGAFEIQ